MTNAQKRQAISQLSQYLYVSPTEYKQYKDICDDPTFQVLSEIIAKLKEEVK